MQHKLITKFGTAFPKRAVQLTFLDRHRKPFSTNALWIHQYIAVHNTWLILVVKQHVSSDLVLTNPTISGIEKKAYVEGVHGVARSMAVRTSSSLGVRYMPVVAILR